MATLRPEGYYRNMALRDIPWKHKRNVVPSIGVIADIRAVGPFAPHPALPTAWINKVDERPFVIPVGKIVCVVPIDYSTAKTLGRTDLYTEMIYRSGEKSTYKWTIPESELGSTTYADPYYGYGGILGFMIPFGSGTGNPRYSLTPGYKISGEEAMPYFVEGEYDYEGWCPFGFVIHDVERFIAGDDLNYRTRQAYPIWREGLLTLPFINILGLVHELEGDDDIEKVDAWIRHKKTAGTTEPTSSNVYMTYKYLSRYYTAAVGTHYVEEYEGVTIYTGYEFNAAVMKDRSVSVTCHGDYLVTQALPPTERWVVGTLVNIDYEFPKSFMEMVDAPPASGIGTANGGIPEIVYQYMHDFVVIYNELAGTDTLSLKPADLISYIDKGYFGAAYILADFNPQYVG